MATLRICFFGDSLTNGVGDTEGLGWAGRVCSAARRKGRDVTSYNLGIRRDTSTDVLRRWRAEAMVRLPAGGEGLLVFAFGTNDCLIENGRRRVARPESLASLGRILAEAASVHPVLVVGPPPVADTAENGRIGALSSDFGELCAAANVPYLDMFTALASAAEWRRGLESGDGYHPDAAGYAAFADRVGNWPAWQAVLRT